MNQPELIEKVAQATELNQAAVGQAVKAVVNAILDALVAGEAVRLSIAVKQEAKLWELRAAASLARLRRDQGRDAEARDLLIPVYDWFTEGFDTPDLTETKALLDELNA